jgi:hypothetical protein
MPGVSGGLVGLKIVRRDWIENRDVIMTGSSEDVFRKKRFRNRSSLTVLAGLIVRMTATFRSGCVVIVVAATATRMLMIGVGRWGARHASVAAGTVDCHQQHHCCCDTCDHPTKRARHGCAMIRTADVPRQHRSVGREKRC